jgi:hypothetical protein
MEEKLFNPNSLQEGTTVRGQRLLKNRGGVTVANDVKGEFTGLFVSSIKFLP